MAFDLSSIMNNKRIRAPRIIMLGVEKIGKSEFASYSPSPCFMPIKGEEGLDDIDAFCTPVCNSVNDVFGWLYSLGRDTHSYETAVLDSASTLEPLVWDSVCEKHGQVDTIEKVMGGYGKGYTEATKVWRQLTEILDALRSEKNMASIIIGHVKVKRFDDPVGGSYDTFQFDIHDKAASLLYRWADAILFANTKTIVLTEDIGFNKDKKRGVDASQNQRFLYTQKRPSHPGGGRGAFGKVPYEMDLNWNTWMTAVGAAS